MNNYEFQRENVNVVQTIKKEIERRMSMKEKMLQLKQCKDWFQN